MIHVTAPRRVSGPPTNLSKQFTKAWRRKNNPTLARFACSRSPSSCVGLPLEVGARDELLLQILRIVNDGGDDQPRIAIRLVSAIEIFRHSCVTAIRHTVLAQISGTHPRGDHLQRTCAWLSRSNRRSSTHAPPWRWNIP